MACTSSLKIPVDAKDQRIARLAQPRRILRHSIQNWLHIRRRAGDDAQDLTRRSLLLQRLLEFLEQSHVFDGNDGLIGEGFEQLNLRRSEGGDLGRRGLRCPMASPRWRSGTYKTLCQPPEKAITIGNLSRSRMSGMCSVPC